MKTHYPYRFKTEQEMINEFGRFWWSKLNWNNPEMNNLLGTILPYNTLDLINNIRVIFGQVSWYIDSSMLTKNEKPRPNYKPRIFVK